MRVNNESLLIVDGAPANADLSADLTLKPVWLGHIANYMIQLFFIGSPVGTFKLQVSADAGKPTAASDAEKYAAVTHWTDVDNSDFDVSAAGDVAWEVQDSGAEWVRVVWTHTSGTGTITSARSKVKGC